MVFRGKTVGFLSKTIVFVGKTMVFLGKTMVFLGKTMVFVGKTLVFLGKTVVFLGKTMVFPGKTMVFLSKTMVFLGKTMVFYASVSLPRSQVVPLPFPKVLDVLKCSDPLTLSYFWGNDPTTATASSLRDAEARLWSFGRRSPEGPKKGAGCSTVAWRDGAMVVEWLLLGWLPNCCWFSVGMDCGDFYFVVVEYSPATGGFWMFLEEPVVAESWYRIVFFCGFYGNGLCLLYFLVVVGWLLRCIKVWMDCACIYVFFWIINHGGFLWFLRSLP